MKKQTLFLSALFLVVVFTIANTPKKTTVKKGSAKKSITKIIKPVSLVAADAIKFDKSNATEDLVVNGKDVLVSGNENKLNITGSVGKILITGKNNDITIGSVKEIIISGNTNFVSWEKSDNSEGKPVIQDKGGYNNIEKRSGNAQTKSEN